MANSTMIHTNGEIIKVVVREVGLNDSPVLRLETKSHDVVLFLDNLDEVEMVGHDILARVAAVRAAKGG